MKNNYAGLETLRAFFNNSKNFFAAKTTVDELATGVAYIDSSSNETVTDVVINETGGGGGSVSESKLVGEIVIDSTKGEWHINGQLYELIYNSEFATTVADTLSKVCTIGRGLYAVCTLPGFGELTSSVFTSSLAGTNVLSMSFVNAMTSTDGADTMGIIIEPTRLYADDAILYNLINAGMSVNYKFYAIGSGGGGGSIDVTAEVGQTIRVKEVDASGKPTAWEAVDLQERTHYKAVEQVELVPHTTFVAAINEDLGIPLYQFLTQFEVEVGKEYTVVFDGVKYTRTAVVGNVGGGADAIAIGNELLFGNNTGEPFAIGYIPSVGLRCVMCFDTNEHSISLITEMEVVHKIPDEYFSGNDFKITVATGLEDDYIMYSTWDEIVAAYKAGKNIFAETSTWYSNVGQTTYRYQLAHCCLDESDEFAEQRKFVFSTLEEGTHHYRVLTISEQQGISIVIG